MVKRIALWATAFVVMSALAFMATSRHQVPSAAMADTAPEAIGPERGAAAMVGAGFGGISLDALETNAIPWKLVAAALVLEELESDPEARVNQATLQRVMERFGFLYPEQIEGIPEEFYPSDSHKPLGLTHGTIMPIGGAPVEVANLGCASCHAGVGYNERGRPDPSIAVPGMPNTSLDLESYTQAVFVALRNHVDDPALHQTAAELFPDMGWREWMTMRHIVLRLARSRLDDLEGQERALPFSNGLPGATNGVPALKQQLGVPLLDGGEGETGFVSIPELALRNQRKRLLADGAYAVPSGAADPTALAAITSFFTVPSMGVHPDVARASSGDAEAIFAWLTAYRPLDFPGEIDLDRARRGELTYGRECASCHGRFEWLQERPELVDYPGWYGDVGTDPLRAEAFTPALAEAVRGTSYADLIEVRLGDGYAAPPLAGLWSSAPYLHNGSVQSLAALLDPSQRLERFMVGGHALDFGSVGLRVEADGRYPQGYRPFSQPQWVDTTKPGLGNGGHILGSDLTEAQRRDLIEFLKLL